MRFDFLEMSSVHEIIPQIIKESNENSRSERLHFSSLTEK